MKKIIALTLSLIMALSLCVPAWGATVEVAASESMAPAGIEYTSGDTVKLTGDVTLNGLWTITDTVTIDLNGFTLSRDISECTTEKQINGKAVIYVNGGNVTVVDSSTGKTGAISIQQNKGTEGAPQAVTLGAGTFTLQSGSINSSGSAVSTYGGNGTFNMEGGTINGWVTGNGNDSGTVFNISGGTIIGSIYHPQNGELNISGGTISGANGVYVKSGTVTISGGNINGTGAKADYVYKPSGYTSTGDALVIESCGYPGGAPVVSVTGGTFKSTNAAVVASYVGNGQTEAVEGFISGGTFYGEPAAELVANGYKAFMESGGKYIVAVPCNVTFDANGGSGELTQDPVPAGTFVLPIRHPFTYEGHIFCGWATDKNAGPDDVLKETYELTGNTTFYAIWREDDAPIVVPPVSGDGFVAIATPETLSALVASNATAIKDKIAASDAAATEISVQDSAGPLTVEFKDVNAKNEFASATDVTTVIEANEETVTKDVTDAVASKVGKKANIAAYMDIDIAVVVNGETVGELTQLPAPIKVVVPADALDFDTLKTGYKRSISVLRFHDNKVDKLSATLESNGDVSFESDKFSTYAVVYEDTSNTPTGGYYPSYGGGGTTTTTPDKEITSPKTFDAGVALYVGISVVGAVGTVVLGKKRED